MIALLHTKAMRLALLLTFLLTTFSGIHAQNFNIGKRALTKFSYECASSSTFDAAKLNQVVPRILKHYPDPDDHVNRAFAFDLNGDDISEYFVPFHCGAVGNCDWAVFSQGKFLGMVNGQYIYVYQLRNAWPRIFAYGHLSAAEGSLETYVFRRRYERQKPYPIGEEGTTLEIQKVRSHKLPQVFEKATSACGM